MSEGEEEQVGGDLFHGLTTNGKGMVFVTRYSVVIKLLIRYARRRVAFGAG